jgi:hypothetical protein
MFKSIKHTHGSCALTLIIILGVCVLFMFVSVVAVNILEDSLFGEHDMEQFDLTYKEYLRKSNDNRIKIPESSQYIDIFGFHMRDYWCNAIQAEIFDGVPDLHAIVADYELYKVYDPFFVENVPSPQATLGYLLGPAETLPAWLQWDDPMFESGTNILKYGQGTYCRGIWAFFEESTHTLWVFSWSGQHMHIGPFGDEDPDR